MTWNEYLYLFWKKHGGTLFATEDQEWNGTLLLEKEKGTILIHTEETGTSRSGISLHHIVVSTQVRLERPYRLQITKSAVKPLPLGMGKYKTIDAFRELVKPLPLGMGI